MTIYLYYMVYPQKSQKLAALRAFDVWRSSSSLNTNMAKFDKR